MMKKKNNTPIEFCAVAFDNDGTLVNVNQECCNENNLVISTLNLIKVYQLRAAHFELFGCTHRSISTVRDFYADFSEYMDSGFSTHRVIANLEKLGLKVTAVSVADDLAFESVSRLGEGYAQLKCYEEEGCPPLAEFIATHTNVKYVLLESTNNKNLQLLSIANHLIKHHPEEKMITLVLIDDVAGIIENALIYAHTSPEWPSAVELKGIRAITHPCQVQAVKDPLHDHINRSKFAPIFVEMVLNSEFGNQWVEYEYHNIITTQDIEEKLIKLLGNIIDDMYERIENVLNASKNAFGRNTSQVEKFAREVTSIQQLQSEGHTNQAIINLLEKKLQKIKMAEQAFMVQSISVRSLSTSKSLLSLSQFRDAKQQSLPSSNSFSFLSRMRHEAVKTGENKDLLTLKHDKIMPADSSPEEIAPSMSLR